MQQALVEVEGVTKQFGDFTAVRDLDLGIESGEFLAIMGSSGCGKTTTLRMLAGLDAPTRGEIRLGGERINELKTWERDTPLVWQNLALFPFLSVIENVEFGLRMRSVGRQERTRRAMDWLGRLGIGEFANRNITQLSGGQRQRVALARSLVTEPPILLLDEPLSALDANLKIRMQAVLTELQKEVGITFVYVTHSHSEAFAMADRVVIMSNGMVEQVGTPQTIYNQPRNRFVAEFIGGKNIITGTVSGQSESSSLVVESAHGTFEVAVSTDNGPVGEASGDVTLCVGADRIEFVDDPADTRNQLDCRIVSEAFVGSMVTVYLETETGLELQVQRPYLEWTDSVLKKGGRVRVAWEADAARLLNAD